MSDAMRILLIEDSENDALLIKRELTRHFAPVVAERVETIEAFRGKLADEAWDAVLCDYVFPGGTPGEALDVLRDTGIDIPFIVVSGKVGEEVVVDVMKAGAHDYVLKDNLTRLGPALARENEEAKNRRARRQAEESLRENRRFLASLLQTLPGMVYRCDLNKNWTMRYLSQGCLELTGYDPYHLLNDHKLSFADMIHKDDRDRVWGEVSRDIEMLRPYQTAYRIRTREGVEKWVMDHGRLASRDRDDAPRLEGYIFDITDLKQTEQALEESRTRFRSISDASNDAIIMINLRGQVVYWNRAAQVVFGFSPEEIIGRNFTHHLVPDDVVAKHRDHVQTFAKTGEIPFGGTTLEVQGKRKDGELIPLEVSLATVRIQDEWHAIASVRDISDRINTLDALRESEEKFRRLVEQSTEGIYLMTGNQFSFVNPRFEELFGYSAEELTGPSFDLLYLAADESRADLRELIRQRQEDNRDEQLTTEIIGRHKSGRKIELETSMTSIQYGGQAATLGIIRDISERKEAERALRASERRFRLLAENARDLVFRFRVDPPRGYEYVSPSSTQIMGYTPEEYYADPDLALKTVHPDDRDLLAAMTRGEVLDVDRIQLRWITKNGKTVWTEQKNVYSRDESGTVHAFEGILRDITEQKEVEQELRKLSDAVEQSPTSLIITDTRGIIEYVNPRFCELSGYGRAEVLGQRPSILKSGEQPEEIYKDLWTTIKAGKVWEGELVNRKKNGDLYHVSTIITPVKDDRGHISNFLGLELDITERKQMEQERQRLESELNRQFHLSQVGLLASGIAHNIRSPLGVILMFATMLQRNVNKVLDAPSDDALTLYESLEDVEGKAIKIIDGAHRIEQIIDDIMAYHQMNRVLSAETVDLNTVIQADAAMLKADLDLKHRVSTQLDLAKGHLWTRIRPSDLSQIFLNLVANARDAMLEGDIRVLTIRSGQQGEEGRVWFEVHDTGRGVPPEVLERLGEPFLTTKDQDPKARERGSGTGLGLYMIKRILAQRGGDLEVLSSPGSTTFRILLPEVEPPQPSEGGHGEG